MRNLKDHLAVVTGASSGIGAAMARQLAAWGCDVLLVARRKDRLEQLCAEIQESYKVKAESMALDLSLPGSALALFEETSSRKRPVDILINNAGFGVYEEFTRIPWERHASLLQLNVLTLVELTHLFVKQMLEGGRPGYVLNVSSIGAYQPVPYFAVYAASKSFVRDFTEALAFELRKTPVTVCSLCPGGTVTEFSDVAGQSLGTLARATSMSAERCARIGLKALLRGRRNIVSGVSNKITCWTTRLLPRRLVTRASLWVLGPPRSGGEDPAQVQDKAKDLADRPNT